MTLGLACECHDEVQSAIDAQEKGMTSGRRVLHIYKEDRTLICPPRRGWAQMLPEAPGSATWAFQRAEGQSPSHTA
jgi:hypothetical protein